MLTPPASASASTPWGTPTIPIASQGAAIFRGAPHPNAAKLYLNWYLSREVQSRMPAGYWPARQDVAPPAGYRPIFEYNVASGFRDFVLDEPRLEELRRRYE